MPADVTKAAKRRWLRKMVAFRKTAGTLEQMFASIRAKLERETADESDQHPRFH